MMQNISAFPLSLLHRQNSLRFSQLTHHQLVSHDLKLTGELGTRAYELIG